MTGSPAGRTGGADEAPGREPAADSAARTASRLPRDGAVPADLFRRALGSHAAGVVVVTAHPAAGPVGMTATSFTSVSLDPPLVSFYVNAGSGSWPGIRDAGAFAVNILDERQHDTAARFAAKGTDRFAPPTRWSHGPEGLPLLHGAVGHVLCLRHDLLAVGDHWLVVGRVADASVSEDGRPLLYHRSRYGRFDA
ncbi:flavin reductase (DIM6/NTAB) family NADH-FMN oxidoreductase RutF [Spinactinospora alkalitolerans]|uniref:Flavin reductase (DIM6/NTAB) family NADH-FMN oxidoreductase RutF n=1 Tax=Spinactinospora alkalitolerans TaxID=687207 RepID=A0A852TZA6_9ACTN|nr:flavin reductase family protein [Spinactinospora alkalitolerans]NYE48362.1 flavin reductase (DIM6/NTAB) family NADH-FMN oxidoreductase RutF [Spinactinospora alkalitolerans]